MRRIHPIRKKIRKKINRSGVYPCQVCNTKNLLIEHHINGREIPNANDPTNLCYICDNCHRKIHEALLIIEGWFSTSNGPELLWHSVDKKSFSGQNAKPYII